MTSAKTKPAHPARCGFSPKCRLTGPHGYEPNQAWSASWNGKLARNRDGTTRHFASESFARAWLAAADATNGESFRHQCS